jgi:hypothetical protein
LKFALAAGPTLPLPDRATDEARCKGRKLLGHEHNKYKKLKLAPEKS